MPMTDPATLAAIALLGLVSYALRAGGYLAGALIRDGGLLARFLRRAPGNLFIAFTAATCLDGGLPTTAGCAAALATMILTKREWAALAAGVIVAMAVAL